MHKHIYHMTTYIYIYIYIYIDMVRPYVLDTGWRERAHQGADQLSEPGASGEAYGAAPGPKALGKPLRIRLYDVILH